MNKNKKTNKKLYWLIPIAWALIALLVWADSQAGVYNNSGTSSEDSISFAGVNVSADGRRMKSISTSDSLYVLCFYPGGALAFRDSVQMNSSKITIAAFEDDARVGAFTYKNAVADIDGGGQNGTYKIVYSLIDIDSNNVSWGITEAQVYATANFSTWADGVMQETDSAIVDRSSLLIYTGNFNTAYSTFNYLTDSVTFDRSNSMLYPGNFSVPYATTAQLGDSMRKVFGDSLATFADSAVFARAVWDNDVVAQSLRLIIVAGMNSGAIDSADFAATAISLIKTVYLDYVNGTLDSTEAGGTLKKMIALRSDSGAVVSGTGYPLRERLAIVDAVGALPKFQFVIDTTAMGGSGEYAHLNKAIAVRDADDGKWYGRGVIERVNCVGDLCTLQVADSLPFAVEVGDSVWFKGDEPAYVIATLSEAAETNAIELLDKDTTGHSTPGSVGGAIASGGTGGSDFDSTEFLVLMANHGWKTALDTLAARMVAGTSASLPLLPQLITESEFESFDLNIAKIKGSSVLVIDSARNVVGGGGSDCSGTGSEACTLFVFKSATPQQGVLVKVRNNAESAVEAEGYTDPDGRVIFNLDVYANYKARVYRAGLSQTTNPQTIPVTANGANDTILVTEIPIGPTTALFSMNLLSPFFRNAEVRYTLTQTSGDIAVDTSANVVIPTVLYDKADTSGVIATALYKNSSIYLMKKKTTGTTQWNVKVRQRGSGTWDNAPIDLTVFIPADSTYFRTTGGM